uniref:Uncharacterized protein n=1 Tax=Sphaerodactylus townsendi TaxID=933632 RepID=A0ACB8G8B7_9SAUR
MLRCTCGSGVRIWGLVGGGSQGLGLFWRTACPVSSWSWGARGESGAQKTPWRRGAVRGVQNSFPLDPAVPQDVLLFQNDRARFFRLLGLFCACQFLFWTYLAHFAFHSLRPTGAKRPESDSQREGKPLPTLPGGATLNPSSNKWRFGFTISCLTVGSLIVVAGFLFSRRSVSRVLLHRRARSLTTLLSLQDSSSFTGYFCPRLLHVHRSEVPP